MEAYIHIPFCKRKCNYCDFLSFTDGNMEQYTKVLLAEIQACGRANKDKQIDTVFIGGGTPSILPEELTAMIMEQLFCSFNISRNAEISMEANPGTVTADKLAVYHSSGINRLSFGLQSADDRELKLLGRIHTYSDFLESYRLAMEAGYDNINIDLISALPGQSVADYEATLRRIVELNPKHISAYSLIIEEGTRFYEWYAENGEGEKEQSIQVHGRKREVSKKISTQKAVDRGKLPDEDTERAIYAATKRILSEAGYRRYEISNYAKPGYECRHNTGYWTGEEYIGLGLGAASYVYTNGSYIRYSNTKRLDEYLASSGDTDKLKREILALSQKDRMAEFMFLGLRMTSGVSREKFEKLFGSSINNIYGDIIKKYTLAGFIITDGDRISLSDRGVDVSNIIMADFIIE